MLDLSSKTWPTTLLLPIEAIDHANTNIKIDDTKCRGNARIR